MKQVLSDLLNRFLAETGLSVEDFVWGTLGVCLFFSTTHLVSMLVTRWGDRRASGKALIFSITVHLACVMGVAGMTLRARESVTPGEQTAIPVQKIVLDDENRPPVNDSGDTPIWEQTPRSEPTQNVRAQLTPKEFEPAEAPDRSEIAQERPAPELPELPMPPASAESPDIDPAPPAEPLAAASLPVAAPTESIPAAEARPDVATSPAVTRSTPARSDGIETPAAQKPAAGSVDRVEKEPSTERLVTSLAAKVEPDGPLPKAVTETDVERRAGPIPSSAEIDAAGTTAEPAANAAVTESRGSDVRRKLSRTDGIEGIETARGERQPLETPPGDRELAVRNSLTSPLGRGAGVPGVARPDAPPLQVRGGAPETYRLRSLARRREVARRYGGTEESEKAVENALRWFASVQEKDGSWDGDKFGAGLVRFDENKVDRQYAGRDADTGLSALVILSFLGAGHTPEEGPYADNVERALKWLIAQQRDDGYLGGNATHYAQMYCHGMATYALAEACGMQSDPAADPLNLREPLRKAVAFILDRQGTDGGWRYEKGQKGDMSMFGWQLMALKSAEIAGQPIPAAARARMVQFLKDRSLGPRSGLAGYRAESDVSAAMTAEALFCKQMLGIARTNPQCVEAIEHLLARLPRREAMDEYYWYYGTLAMYQYGGAEWEQWNDALRDLLVADQVMSGPHAGSWEPRGVWGRYGGRIYQTALSTLCLEVYYRFLPLHQLNGGQ